ncbi:SURF1 family protein [Sinorhizobium sp. BG8]|uniref:SURF1 family protein n=1 Tax=Sinorhizobium sp. BG8 TaxID=2613773 RepID=UPI00193D8AAB|nr:SURF1 family protein [Sinorhizobium sp. BG8]QRM57660.1 SURF1 family protein [Sinorhizobium sp. BG8]
MAADHPPTHDMTGAGLDGPPRSRLLFAGALLFLAFAFIGLGTWQIQRLFWKLDLIERVDARVTAEPVPPPPIASWAGINAANDEYRRVTTTGTFDHGKEVLVQAVTERGSGFWLLTPLHQADGTTILINRGFVPSDRRDPSSRSAGEVTGSVQVTGLLRLSEPGGAFLRSNDPENDRWYSRDVAAIADAKGLSNVAPYFIDADSTPNPGGLPIGGMTVVSFRNSHLVYALTWFALAAMSIGGAIALRRYRPSAP